MKKRLLVCWLFLHGLLGGQSAVKRTVCASGCDYVATRAGFQSALNAAAAAQASNCAPYIVEIAAGSVVEISGNPGLLLPSKSCRQYVTIRSGVAFTDGVRLNPTTESGKLATLKAVDYVGALMGIAEGATTSYWRFEGIDFWVYGGDSGYPNYYGLLIGNGTNPPISWDPSTRPHHFEIKHCWFRGTPGARNALNGIGIGGNNVRILDSYFEAWAGATAEGRAIGIGLSDGPVEVRNNRLSGAAQNVLVGGLPQAKGQLPSFLSFVGNRMGRDPYMRFMTGSNDPTIACREGNVWQNTSTSHDWACNSDGTWVDQNGLTGYGGNLQKTIWEAKVARGTRMFGNIFEDAWYPLTWTIANFIVVNQTSSNGTLNGGVWTTADQWATVSDMRIWGNKFTKGNAILAVGYPGERPCTLPGQTGCMHTGASGIRMWNNLGYDLADVKDSYAGTLGAGGYAQWAAGSFDMEYRNNTFLTSTTEGSGVNYGIGRVFDGADRNDSANLQQVWGQNILRDNIGPTGAGLGSGFGGPNYITLMGECSLVLGMKPGAGGYDARNNFWTNDLPWYWADSARAGHKSPLNCGWTMFDPNTDFGQWWQASTVVQDRWAAVVDSGTHKVKPAYQGQGSDGRDPGANVDFVDWATAGTATGEANPFLDMKIRSIRASSTAATLYLTAPSVNACVVELSQSNRFDALTGSVDYSQTGKDIRAIVSGLTPGTYYFVRTRCDGYELESTLLTSP